MKPPSPLARLAGSPVGAIVLFLLYGWLWLGWYMGGVRWWVALGAVGAALRTVGAIGQVRRYKAWGKEWQAMGE